jgi:hypothetical protein
MQCCPHSSANLNIVRAMRGLVLVGLTGPSLASTMPHIPPAALSRTALVRSFIPEMSTTECIKVISLVPMYMPA